MKIRAVCPSCREAEEKRSALRAVGSSESFTLVSYNITDLDEASVSSGKLTIRCSQGHTVKVRLPIPDHELLFDLGCFALLDGYAREAVTSFAASFERYMEFSCRMLLARRNPSLEMIDWWWKEVAGRSDAQFGSYVGLWPAEFMEPAPVLVKRLIELRNSCVHKGRIPTDEEAGEYGEAVLRAEVAGIVRLRNRYDSDMEFDDDVERFVLRLTDTDREVMGFWQHNVINSMWRSEEFARGDEDEDAEGPGQLEPRSKNPTDASKLTIERALRAARLHRALLWTRPSK